jgi:hypothetical protein
MGEADYGSGGWGFESLAARHRTRWSAALSPGRRAMARRRTATQLRTRWRALPTPLRPPATPPPTTHRQPEAAAPASSGGRAWCSARHLRPVQPDIPELPEVVADGLEFTADPLAGHQRQRSRAPYAQGARTPALHHRSVCPGRCPSGGVVRPRRVVRFARLMQRRVRVPGPAFGPRRLRWQSQPALAGTQGRPCPPLATACITPPWHCWPRPSPATRASVGGGLR